MRRIAFCVLPAACAACWRGAPAPPPPAPRPPLATVRPPLEHGLGAVQPLRGPVLVLTPRGLYLVRDAGGSPVVVPAGAARLTLAHIASALDAAGVPRARGLAFPGVPVVAAGTVSSATIGELADALRDAGRCLVAVVEATRRGEQPRLAAVGPGDCTVAGGGDDTVQLTIDIAPDHTWVGISRVNEFFDIPRPDATGKLELALKSNKTSAFFTDRSDVEVCGELAVPYSDLVEAAELAVQAGFTSPLFVSLQRASATPQL